MRIISGKYKGRHFDVPRNFKARPTTDFAKENLFNILSNIIDFEETAALDIFSGTGSISLELLSRGCKVELAPIAEVKNSWSTAMEAFKDTLEHEKKVTALINNLAAIAKEDADFASINRIVWFIDEQVEEEESARDMIQAVEAVEGNKYGMYMLDKELAARVYNTPSPLATAE